MNEFEIIDNFFRRLATGGNDVLLGIGDDAALLAPTTQATAVCTDTLVADVHFAADDDPYDVGFKSLAVNLSDLAAMGARPAWAMLNLVMPKFDESWLEGFCRGFADLASRHGIALVGGDTTRGPLCVSVQAGGMVDTASALRRDAARAGHHVFLTGPVGDGWLGLQVAQGRYRPGAADEDYLLDRLRRPQPAIGAGLALAGVAAAAIDISDGLLADLGHVLAASGGLGADLVLDDPAWSAPARRYLADGGEAQALVTGGDDYVLCFTAPEGARQAVMGAGGQGGFTPVEIGVVTAGGGIAARDGAGREIAVTAAGYRHFDDR